MHEGSVGRTRLGRLSLLKRINELVKDMQRDAFHGIGKPESLRGSLSGYWSRRIDDTNRIVYDVMEDVLRVIACRGHYS